MIGKPFRPPLLREDEKPERPTIEKSDEPQIKRRRISDIHDGDREDCATHLVFKNPLVSSLPRKPLLAVTNSAIGARVIDPPDRGIRGYYNVLWFETFPT